MHSGKIIYPDLNHREAVVKANAGTNTIIIMMTKNTSFSTYYHLAAILLRII